MTVSADAYGLATLNPGLNRFNVICSPYDPDAISSIVGEVDVDIAFPPAPNLTRIINAATLQPGPISPGEILTLIGDHLGPLYDRTETVQIPPGYPLRSYPTRSGGTTVSFNGILAPIIYAALGQINVVVPSQIAGSGMVAIEVNHYLRPSQKITVPVEDTSPGIFTLDQNGSGQGAILNSDGSRNSSSNPALKGSTIQIFGTGAGLFTQLNFPDGFVLQLEPPFPSTIAPLSVEIGGMPAQVTYAGPAPRLVFGVLQVNAIIPEGVPSGAQPIRLKAGPNTNQQTVTVEILDK